ncbi:MAG: hypothetical protein H8E46_06120 [FCB group bacterium]|nr:hypothetical protein [FCB group bacterium]
MIAGIYYQLNWFYVLTGQAIRPLVPVANLGCTGDPADSVKGVWITPMGDKSIILFTLIIELLPFASNEFSCFVVDGRDKVIHDGFSLNDFII